MRGLAAARRLLTTQELPLFRANGCVIAGDDGTTCSSRLSERIDDADEQYQLQGGSPRLHSADTFDRLDRPERCGYSTTARIDGNHSQYLECWKLGWFLFDVSSDIDRLDGIPVGSGGSSNSIIVNPNNTQPITSLVTDKNGTVLTGLALEFESTTPTTIPVASSGTVTPTFPGAAALTAVCQPPTCNPSPFNQIGLFGNGKPVTSNAITVTAPGHQQHESLYCKHELSLPGAGGLYAATTWVTGSAALPTKLDGDQRRWQLNLHGQRL